MEVVAVFFLCPVTDISATVAGEGKGKGHDTCYSAAYMSQTRDQQRFYNLGTGS